MQYPTPWNGIHLGLSQGNLAEVIEQMPAFARLGINVLVPEVNFHYEFAAHPELRSERAISKDGARALAAACRDYGIRLIPQFQCLGHQSWAKRTFELLTRYPEFDESPGLYPDNEGIYCRSWCPQHPDINPLVFTLFDELLDAFQADALHVGMDEVFIMASVACPRCRGGNPAELFAKAVNDYHAHLVGKRGVEMLLWGDRLLDSETTGYGEWEAAANGTAPAIDLIPTDIVICDWHYTKRDDYPSVPLFQQKGFRVWPGGWNEVDATEALIAAEKRHAGERMIGHLCTTWGSVKVPDMPTWPPILAAMKR